jgi:hypothetical protein
MKEPENVVKEHNNEFLCNFCNSTFALKRTLQHHIKTSKKCIENRPKIEIKCIWCKSQFITRELLEKHYKNCQADKEDLYKELLNSIKSKDKDILTLNNIIKNRNKENEICKDKDILNLNNIVKNKDKEIENLNTIIKDLTSKLNNNVINNTTTNNNPVTYNITLNCGKPLNLDKNELFKLIKDNCGPGYITRGQLGLVDWFTDHVCRNENYELTLECTDKKRKIFRYIDRDDCPRQINGEQIMFDIREIIPEFMESDYYKQALFEAEEEYKNNKTDYINKRIKDFRNPGKVFIDNLVEKTHIQSPYCLISKKTS